MVALARLRQLGGRRLLGRRLYSERALEMASLVSEREAVPAPWRLGGRKDLPPGTRSPLACPCSSFAEGRPPSVRCSAKSRFGKVLCSLFPPPPAPPRSCPPRRLSCLLRQLLLLLCLATAACSNAV